MKIEPNQDGCWYQGHFIPFGGGEYILVLVKNLAEVLCPAYPEQSNVIIAQVSA